MFFLNLIKYYFAFKTRLKISDQKLPNFAECIAGKGKFCGRNAATSCAKNYGASMIVCLFLISFHDIFLSNGKKM